MDVDLLRTGTVPINPETVLWFEFLLNPSVLENHLHRMKPDPSPTELIIKFMSIAPELPPERTVPSGGEPDVLMELKKDEYRRSKKSLALKIMSLKIAAFLKWDLTILEAKLPLPMQVTLLQDLLLLSQGCEVPIQSHEQLDIDKCPPHVLFAVLLYHRWVLRATVGARLSIKQPRPPFIPIPGLQDPLYVPPMVLEEMGLGLEAQVSNSVALLNRVATAQPHVKLQVPVYQTFVPLSEDTIDIRHCWEAGPVASTAEIQCQVHYDLGAFFFSREEYAQACEQISQAAKLFSQLPSSPAFCVVQECTLRGYCAALGVAWGQEQPNLLVEFLNCASNQYMGIVSILQQDNLLKEISLVHRDALELDIQAAAASTRFFVARDLLMQVQILNAVRRAMDGPSSPGSLVARLQMRGTKGLDLLVTALVAVLPKSDACTLERLRVFILDLVEAGVPELATVTIACKDLANLFTPEQLTYLKSKATSQATRFTTDKEGSNFVHKNPRLHVGSIEQDLILSNEAPEIRNLVTQLNSLNPMKPPWKINKKWELPIPLQSVVMSLPRGFLQDITFVLLAKSRELVSACDFEGSKRMLVGVEEELRLVGTQLSSNVVFKLGRLVSWEILLVNIMEFLEEWPSHVPGVEPSPSSIDRVELAAQCKACLRSLQAGEAVIPRLEVLEHCALCLLNLREWDLLTGLDRRWSYFELSAALANACQDIDKFKGTKKVSRRDAWEMILPVFGPSQQKRSSSGTSTSVHRDSPGAGSLQGRAQLQQFILRLRDQTTIAVVVSLLTRLFNVLKDESNLELNVEYSMLWPSVISNSNSFNSRYVIEVLTQLLHQALKYYPNNVSWLKLLGDISFVNGHYSNALKNYLKACIAVSNYFSQPVPKSDVDDQVYRRMIKCCSQLQCHTQAAVLCQFLEEVDYATAFKSIQEKSSADAMDAYYSCIWDVTMLEFLVYFHAKRGEQDRKQQANKILGLLELNANNNEEIRREAANIRKATFMRAMVRQYVC